MHSRAWWQFVLAPGGSNVFRRPARRDDKHGEAGGGWYGVVQMVAVFVAVRLFSIAATRYLPL